MTRTLIASGFAAVCLAQPALAELTAEAALADQLNLLSLGGKVSVATDGLTASPDGLSVSAFVLRPANNVHNTEIRLSGVDYHEQPDGGVEVVYPDTFSVTASWTSEEYGRCKTTFAIYFNDLIHTVSGGRGNLRHDIVFASAILGDFQTNPPEAIGEMDANLELMLTDWNSTLSYGGGRVPEWQARFELGNMTSRVEGVSDDTAETFIAATEVENAQGIVTYVSSDIPRHSLDLSLDRFAWLQDTSGEGSEAVNITFLVSDMDAAYDAALSFEALENDPGKALADGQMVEGHLSYSAMMMDVNGQMPEGETRSLSTAGETTASLALDQRHFALSMETVENHVEMGFPSGPFLPFETMAYDIARHRLDIDVPLLANDERQPFTLKAALVGLTLDDQIWNLFDSKGVVPRDPLTMEIDLSGSTIVTENAIAAGPGVFPFQETLARLNNLRLGVAGADLAVTGELRDTSVDGSPSGYGKLDGRLTGVQTLLDTLVELGSLQPEHAMAARMGLNLITRPGDGPDELLSTIELKEDGSILANGLRIK